MRARAVKIKEVVPSSGIEGGKVEIRGSGFDPEASAETEVLFGDALARILLLSTSRIIVQIPEEGQSGGLTVQVGNKKSSAFPFALGKKLAGDLQPVDNPVYDRDGNLYVTFSGRRGETAPVSVFRINPQGQMKPYLSNVPNATSMAFDGAGNLYVSSRFEGNVYKSTPSADVTIFAKELGTPTGLAFDGQDNLYVGDRAGRVLKLSPSGEVAVFAELPESMVAFHLAFDKDGHLLVTAPNVSTSNNVFSIDRQGKVTVVRSGFGRPQGIAVDGEGNVYVCEAKAGDSGLVKIAPDGQVSIVVAAPVIVGIAFDPHGNVALASQEAVDSVPLGSGL